MKYLLRKLDDVCGNQYEKGSYEKEGKCVKCPDLVVECVPNIIFKCESPYIVNKDSKNCVDKYISKSLEIMDNDQYEKDLFPFLFEKIL